MRTDYWTRAEFRAFIKDTGDPPKYSDEQIDGAQAEVIERLENWARSSWATVVENAPDSDGRSTEPRSTEQVFDGSRASYALDWGPVVEVMTATLATSPLSATAYYMDTEENAIRFDLPLGPGIRVLRIGYTYGDYPDGVMETPASIKRAGMLAAKTLIQQDEPKRIPARVRQMTTERTMFVFEEGALPPEPWPWDQQASELVRSFREQSVMHPV